MSFPVDALLYVKTVVVMDAQRRSGITLPARRLLNVDTHQRVSSPPYAGFLRRIRRRRRSGGLPLFDQTIREPNAEAITR